MLRPGLHPPLPAVRINNNLLPRVSVSDAPCDRIDPLSAALRRGGILVNSMEGSTAPFRPQLIANRELNVSKANRVAIRQFRE